MKTIQDILTESPDATDAEILAAIEASRDWRRVPIADVTAALFALRLNGILIVAANDQALPVQLRVAVAEFNRGVLIYQSLDASDARIRGDIQDTLGGLVQSTYVQQAQADAFLDLLKEPMTVTQATIDRYRREREIQSDIDAAAQATDGLQAFIAAARNWIAEGGEKPTP